MKIKVYSLTTACEDGGWVTACVPSLFTSFKDAIECLKSDYILYLSDEDDLDDEDKRVLAFADELTEADIDPMKGYDFHVNGEDVVTIAIHELEV